MRLPPTVEVRAVAADLTEHLVPLLRAWLPGRRWFAGRGRAPATVEPASAVWLRTGDPGLLHLLVRVGFDGSAPDDLYQVLLGTRHTLPDRLAPSLLGRVDGGSFDGLVVHDALYDGELTRLLLDALSVAEEAPGPLDAPGPGVRLRRAPGARVPSGLAGRIGTAEQTNTSVVYGSRAILKIFRRLEPGLNPDLELTLALQRQECAAVPDPLAWIEAPLPGPAAAEPTTLALLQEFLADGTDGWELALASVRRATARAAGPDTDPGAGFTEDARRLGRATAEVHRALADALGTERLSGPQASALAEQMSDRLDAVAAEVPQLRPHRDGLRAVFRELAGRPSGALLAQRTHGDLHLGQTLRTPDGWRLIDFEGEPARPLAERRLPRPAERDVAGMLRSFDYAAGHAGPAGAGHARARAWADANRAAYLAGYAAAAGPSDATLLRAFETDKAVYEVGYEARHRPDWLPIPLAATARLAAQPD
ncbi:hypothetical protein BIV57_12165 [Mangrovactinospora gilvigrisea]|uniref:Maltokinase n=1 Tax=Mangrovactinospora gilvigrisea TaxID=1428644 RepID=A0A1J7C6M3_9ACTN|nr:phosphotransferase [Mangrovactinospora gilvigrisea]OIV37216.1 hypothetical protein BIV57_12165 [Mangrovactinospora gilvigrisea]